MSLTTLIDKLDNFEIVRDQIAGLLALEIANQQTLAIDQSLDATLWRLRVLLESASPLELFPDATTDTSPVVNVWYESTQFEKAGSNVMERQKAVARYNLDVYGYGVNRSNLSGFVSGDKTAAMQAAKGARLVRNILMAAENTYLQLRGVVGARFIESINAFQPEIQGRDAFHVVGVRLVISVEFNEFSPQVEAVELETVAAEVKRLETDEVVVRATYDYT